MTASVAMATRASLETPTWRNRLGSLAKFVAVAHPMALVGSHLGVRAGSSLNALASNLH